MKKLIFQLFCFFLPLVALSQTEFKSKRFNYSFTIASGWSIKDKIFDPESDAKLTDGKGNTFYVKIKTSIIPGNQTAKEYWETKSDKEIDSTLSTVDCKAKVTERGSLTVDGEEFYYIYSVKKFANDTKTFNRSYYLNHQSRTYIITTKSVDTDKDKTKKDIEAMINSFKFD
jgi:hypothetical protein